MPDSVQLQLANEQRGSNEKHSKEKSVESMTQVCRPLRNVILHDELYIKPHRIRSGERTIIGGEDVTDCHCYCLTSPYSPPTIVPFSQRYHFPFALSLSPASLHHSITLYSYFLFKFQSDVSACLRSIFTVNQENARSVIPAFRIACSLFVCLVVSCSSHA